MKERTRFIARPFCQAIVILVSFSLFAQEPGTFSTTPPGTGALPAGCITPSVSGGGTYYLCGNTWFSPAYGANGIYYRVVPTP